MKTVESCETKIYACSSGVPTISVGYALLINGKDGWDIRKKLFAEDCDFVDAGITLPSDFEPQKFGSPDTKKSHEFFKSFITEKDEAKEKAEKEKEEQKKREEERVLLAKEKEWKEARYKKEREKMRKEGEEAAKKRDGWIIAGCKLYNRKDYYGV